MFSPNKPILPATTDINKPILPATSDIQHYTGSLYLTILSTTNELHVLAKVYDFLVRVKSNVSHRFLLNLT